MARIFTDKYVDDPTSFEVKESLKDIRNLLVMQAPVGFIAVTGEDSGDEYLINVAHIGWVEE